MVWHYYNICTNLAFRIAVADLEMVHGVDQDLHTHVYVSVDLNLELCPVLVRVALTMNDPHLLDEGTLPCFSST